MRKIYNTAHIHKERGNFQIDNLSSYLKNLEKEDQYKLRSKQKKRSKRGKYGDSTKINGCQRFGRRGQNWIGETHEFF